METKMKCGLAVAAGLLIALPAVAQSLEWKAGSDRSFAEVLLTTGKGNSYRSNVLGFAALNADLRVDRTDLSKSTMDFDFCPSGFACSTEATAHRASGGTAPVRVHFRSGGASVTAQGDLKITGTLTVTRVVREMDIEANEGYDGPLEVGRTIVRASRREALVLPVPATAPPAAGAEQLAAALQIRRDEFPELLEAVKSTNWSAWAQDPVCVDSPNPGNKDYAGTLCTGSMVETSSITQGPGSPVSAPLPGDLVTLVLRFAFAGPQPGLSRN